MTRYEIFQKLETENARAKEKHGMWSSIPETEQATAIRNEFAEWYGAYVTSDINGEHGEIVELIQLAQCCFRRVQFLTGEADA